MAAGRDGLRRKPASRHHTRIGRLRPEVRALAAAVLIGTSGCVSDRIDRTDPIAPYQEALVHQGPQGRLDTKGPESLIPLPRPRMPRLQVVTDETAERKTVKLSVEDVLVRALANSPEITVTSYDPAIAREEVTKAASAFDLTASGRVSYDDQDNPTDSIFRGGESTELVWESALGQRFVTGAEWSLSYTMGRTSDDLVTRILDERWEPFISFQVRQPLLRDAWPAVNLAGVDVARLNYEIALASFRQRANDVSAEAITAYWILWQARRDVGIQEDLLAKTLETLKRVQDRREIDASSVQIKQAEAFARSREAELFQAEKRAADVQDALVRMLSDDQLNLMGDYVLVPATTPVTESKTLDREAVLALATEWNPLVIQARIAVEITDINVRVANLQQLPRLDVVASARMSGLSKTLGEAHEDILEGKFFRRYGVGVTFEVPLGNRERRAEARRRRLERDKAVTGVQNVSDQVAAEAKERLRRAEVAGKEMVVQRGAVEAAALYLQALEDTEKIRERLTPEFILVKLQAQELLARAQRDEIRAIVDYNTALIRLAQSTGTVFDMRYARWVLPRVRSMLEESGGDAVEAAEGSPEPGGTSTDTERAGSDAETEGAPLEEE